MAGAAGSERRPGRCRRGAQGARAATDGAEDVRDRLGGRGEEAGLGRERNLAAALAAEIYCAGRVGDRDGCWGQGTVSHVIGHKSVCLASLYSPR